MEFDPNGRALNRSFRSEEFQLYVALGGKAQFPGQGPTPQR